jgi:hypothetical protein
MLGRGGKAFYLWSLRTICGRRGQLKTEIRQMYYSQFYIVLRYFDRANFSAILISLSLYRGFR